jgi:hypothetical protein
VAPLPENTNHFNSVWVFHKESRTMHVDDTIFYAQDPGFLLSLGGFKKGSMQFHPSIKGPGLLPNPESPYQFRDFVASVIKDWDFDCIVTAHAGIKATGAKAQLQETLNAAEPLFKELSEKKHKQGPVDLPTAEEDSVLSKQSECG